MENAKASHDICDVLIRAILRTAMEGELTPELARTLEGALGKRGNNG